MEIIRCTRCGSTRLILKRVEMPEKNNKFLDVLVYVFLGILTLGLYFIFCAMNEKQKNNLGTEYYECEDCHLKMSSNKISYESVVSKKEENISEEEKREIREIGRNPVNMNVWKGEREEAVRRKRQTHQNDEER